MATYSYQFTMATAQTGVSGHYPLKVINSTYTPANTFYIKTGDIVSITVLNSEDSGTGEGGVRYNDTVYADDPDPTSPDFDSTGYTYDSGQTFTYTVTSATEDIAFEWWFYGTPHPTSGYKYSQSVRMNRVSASGLSASPSTVKQGGEVTFTVSGLSGLLAPNFSNDNRLNLSIFNSSNQWITAVGDSGIEWDSSTNQLGKIKTTDTSTVCIPGTTLPTGTYTTYLTHYNGADSPGGNIYMGSEHRLSGASTTFTVNAGTVSQDSVRLGVDVVTAPLSTTYIRDNDEIGGTAISTDGVHYKPTISIVGTGTGNDAKYKRYYANNTAIDSSWRSDSTTIEHGQRIKVSLTGPDSYNATTTLTLTVGDVSDNFSVTTDAADVEPDEFEDDLTDVTDNSYTGGLAVDKSTNIESNIMTLSGTNQITSIACTSSSSPNLSVFRKRVNSGGSWTPWATWGTLEVGYQWQFRVTSANAYSTEETGTVNIGGETGSIIHSTIPDPGDGSGGGGGGSGTSDYGLEVYNEDDTVIFGVNMRSANIIKNGDVAIPVASIAVPQYVTVTGIEGLTADNDDDVAIILSTPQMSSAIYIAGITLDERGTGYFKLKSVNGVVTTVDWYVVRI